MHTYAINAKLFVVSFSFRKKKIKIEKRRIAPSRFDVNCANKWLRRNASTSDKRHWNTFIDKHFFAKHMTHLNIRQTANKHPVTFYVHCVSNGISINSRIRSSVNSTHRLTEILSIIQNIGKSYNWILFAFACNQHGVLVLVLASQACITHSLVQNLSNEFRTYVTKCIKCECVYVWLCVLWWWWCMHAVLARLLRCVRFYYLLKLLKFDYHWLI